jgi:hypothetical protein
MAGLIIIQDIIYTHIYIYRFSFRFIVFSATFSNISATSFSGGRSRSTRREPPTMGKQMVYSITGG